MTTTALLNIVSYMLPALITGAVAYSFFQLHINNEEGRRRYLLHKSTQTDILPIKLQAYERLVLFLERIHPTQLLIRVKPLNDDVKQYEELLVSHIEQEFEHNITQQIYLPMESWNVIVATKNTLIQNIVKAATTTTNAHELRTQIISSLQNTTSPTNLAIDYLKADLQQVMSL